MQPTFCIVIAVIILVTTSACSGAIHKKFNIDQEPPESLAIDARQRVVLVTHNGGKHNDKHVVCAEPSPDVFATLAAATSADIGIAEKKVGFSGSLAEAARALGPRTQTIQLLRDGLFRACEAYMNGIIDWREYKLIVTRYDEAMITTLAIDGLTQHYTTAPPLTSSTTASADDSTRSTSAGHTTAEEEANTPTPPPPSGAISTAAAENNNTDTAQVIKEILSQYYEFQLLLQDKITESLELQERITANELRLKQIDKAQEETTRRNP